MDKKTLDYIINPGHPLTIGLIGAGATGCEVARHLAKMNGSLIELGHPGFYVVCSDPDTIGRENIFRQPYTANEVGLNKAAQLISKINRSFGTQWKSDYLDWNDAQYENSYSGSIFMKPTHCFNILITCVDSVKTRWQIKNVLDTLSPTYYDQDMYKMPMLWMDFGNGLNFGQVILSDLRNKIDPMANVFDIYPDAVDYPEEPSCSLAVSLGRQDLFINSDVAGHGMSLLWRIMRKAEIKYNCIFVNQDEDQPVRKKLIFKNAKRNLLLPMPDKAIAPKKGKAVRRIAEKATG